MSELDFIILDEEPPEYISPEALCELLEVVGGKPATHEEIVRAREELKNYKPKGIDNE